MSAAERAPPPPALTHNARQFILFRVFFNCRFYYPVYAVLFSDFGLTIQEFAILNAAWAVAIGVLEIPSGALADQIGRKRLVVFASILMVAEMLLLLALGTTSFVLLFYCLQSQIYRNIDIRDADFGYIGATISLVGIGMAIVCERMITSRSPSQNFAFVGVLVFLGGLALANPVSGWWGIACLLPILFSMRFMQYFISYYLNLVTDSAQRATVLSFRGLSVNLAFGFLFLLFSILTSQLEARGTDPDSAFRQALAWFPWAFAGTSIAIYAFSRLRNRHSLTEMVAEHEKLKLSPAADSR